MRLTITAVIFVLLLGALVFPHIAAQRYCPAELEYAVLHALTQKIGTDGEAPELDYMSGDRITKEAVAQEQNEIDCIRTWAAKHVTDSCTRSQYTEWLDYYQHNLDEAKHELSTRSQENEQTKYERDENARRARVAKFERDHPIPKPPQCPK